MKKYVYIVMQLSKKNNVVAVCAVFANKDDAEFYLNENFDGDTNYLGYIIPQELL